MKNTAPPIVPTKPTGPELLKSPSGQPEPIIKSGDISGVLSIITFLGITPFSLLGIHDRFMGRRGRFAMHIFLFAASIGSSLFYKIFAATNIINDNSHTQQIAEDAMAGLLLVSYIMGVIHTIGYRRFIRENPHLFIDPELEAEAEEEYEDKDNNEGEDAEDSDEDDEPFTPESSLKL